MNLKIKAGLYTFLFLLMFIVGLVLASYGYAKAIMWFFILFIASCFMIYTIYIIIYSVLKYNYESKK